MTRYLRYLRIAFSVTCGIAAVLFVVLWVRSYWWCDSTTGQYGLETYRAISCRGRFGFAWVPADDWFDFTRKWEFRQIVSRGDYLLDNDELVLFGHAIKGTPRGPMAFGVPATFTVSYPTLAIPFAIGTLITTPWISWSSRFSLRTLLIAITLVAVLLGLAVWAVR